MENNIRPLQHLTEAELIQLWNRSVRIDDMAQKSMEHISGYGIDTLMTPTDVRFVRAGVTLQAKLCKMYGVPIPPIYLKLDDEIEERLTLQQSEEENTYDQVPFEYETGDLHRTMDRFAAVDGIGDFEEEELFYGSDELQPLLDEEEGAEEMVDEFLIDEMTYAGYRSMISLIRQCGPEIIDVCEIRVAKSKKMALLSAAVEKGEVSPAVGNFWDSFSDKLMMRTYRWIPIDNSEEIKDDEWCCFYAILNHCEEGILIGDLMKYMCTRIGAFIAQEFAERYCCCSTAAVV